ncbi:MAG: hypothetical protein H6662_15370 [Ardenticatenaceae bacterium]|nr:hypothetical protein [Anaerolineales bacterium]MCB8922967.1 hypothetical protein [Ardenticatenaceae bacterium]MCB8990300.1 hypothetical protein [Ardenticatenaceae bacterium]
MQKKTQYILLGSGVTLLTLFILLTLVLAHVRAEQSIINISENPLTQTSQIASPDNQPTLSTNLTNEVVAAERNQLLTHWLQSLSEKPGWWHIVTFYDQAKKEYGTLPNGITIPEDYLADTWYLLDESGSITQMVNIMRDLEGNTVQFSTFREGIYQVFAMNMKYESAPPVIYEGYSLNALQTSLLSKEESNVDGQLVITFTAREMHAPISMEEVDGQFAIGHLIKENFNRETGEPLQGEIILLLEDGSESVLGRTETQTVKWANQLPEEIANLLAQEIDSAEGERHVP